MVDPASTDRPLSVWDSGTHNWRSPTGKYEVLVGSSVSQTLLTGGFTVH